MSDKQSKEQTEAIVNAEIDRLATENETLRARIQLSHEGETLVKISFSKPAKSIGQTIYNYTVHLGGAALPGVGIRGQVTRDKNGNELVRVPSAYGSDFVVAVDVVEKLALANGTERTFSMISPEGREVMEAWVPRITTAYLAFKATGKAEQIVSFR